MCVFTERFKRLDFGNFSMRAPGFAVLLAAVLVLCARNPGLAEHRAVLISYH